jgi:hypothetical protein
MYGRMGGMEKTTVYLTSAQKAALAQTAAEQQRSEATIIRAGIDVVTARHRTGEAPTQLTSRANGPDPAPTDGRPRWIARDVFVRAVLRHPADPGLRNELRDIAPDTTDELPLR